MTKRRGLLIAVVAAVMLFLMLAVALATVGSRLDSASLDREDLQFELSGLRAESDNLRTERDALKTERETLKSQADQQLKTIEQLKTEVEHARSQSAAAPAHAP